MNMTQAESNRARLQTLIENGSVALSRCSREFLHLLKPLLDAGVLAERRAGAGRQMVVQNSSALMRFASKLFPRGEISGLGPGRVSSVAQFRDSKVLGNSEKNQVSIRAWNEDALVRNGLSAGAASATIRHGVFSFMLSGVNEFRLAGPCALVENPALFLNFERLGMDVGLAILSNGRISNRLLDWLAGAPLKNFSLLHLPDYDPVGLSDYVRLQQRLGDRVRLYIPSDLSERFAAFSNTKLLKNPNSRALIAKLRASELKPVRQVLDLIERNNAGLEQEALLIDL